jgi:DNA modification methylase
LQRNGLVGSVELAFLKNFNKFVSLDRTHQELELLAIPIGNSSIKGDEVVDFFGGSGSTLMTCDQMERICKTMELDPIFCDVIKKRYFEWTGIEPVLLFRLYMLPKC